MKSFLTRAAVVAAALSGAGALAAPPPAPKPAAAPAAKPAAAPAPKPVVPARPSPIWAVAFSPDGKRIAFGAYREVRVRDLEASATSVLATVSGPVRSLAWSPDGQRLAAGSGKPGALGEVALVQGAGGGSPSVALQGHKDVVESVAFTASGKALLSGSMDEKGLAFDLESGKVIRPLQDHTSRVTSVATSPSGKYVATGSLDRTVKIWSGADYTPLANIDNTGGQVQSVAFLPTGEQVALAGEDGNIRIYRLTETKTGSTVGVNAVQVRTIAGNRKPLLALATTAKGGCRQPAADDRTVRLYDFNSGSLKQTLKDSPDAVYSVALSPDGTTVAAGCRDGKVRLWSTADGKLTGEF